MTTGTQPAKPANAGPCREYLHFLRHHPAWYLVPIAAVLASIAWAVFSGGRSDPSFSYPIF